MKQKIWFSIPVLVTDSGHIVEKRMYATVHYGSMLVPPGYAGITLGRQIHIWRSREASPPVEDDLLIKHECVHVKQWVEKGKAKFLAGYLWSWARNGFKYSEIEHEREAYEKAHTVRIRPCG